MQSLEPSLVAAKGRRGGGGSIWGACQLGAIHAGRRSRSPAGSSPWRECKEVKKWRGRMEDAGKIALKKQKKRAQMQESINEEQPLRCVDGVRCQLGLPEALVQLQKSIPHPFTPVPCWWHLGVSVLCIYMHSRVVETAAASTLDMESPFVLPTPAWAAGQRVSRVWISSPCVFICLSDPLNKTSIRKAGRQREGLLNVTVMSAALGAEQPPKSRELCNIYRNRIC